MSYFPMFVNLQDQECLIAGGGNVSLRKAEKLFEFGAHITVVAPGIVPELLFLPQIHCVKREFVFSDLEGKALVVAATGNPELNHRIAEECRRLKIPVNAVDQVEDCSFIFPSYLKQGEVVAAFSSGGQSPVITQYLKKQVHPLMTELIGELAQSLGSIRDQVKITVTSEAMRKQVYMELLSLGLETGTIPSQESIDKAVEKYAEKAEQ